MNLDVIWEKFMIMTSTEPAIKSISKKIFSGFPFLYIHSYISKEDIERLLFYNAAAVMKGKRLQADIIFVREQDQTFVYRMRFYVPNEKLVCCGRGCRDCIRFRDSTYRVGGGY
ncbi:hypothetical protein [Alkalihalophilus marmarensis]|uniref:Uncharacterized protein n=1 Tax=Alkalihalophilus marmarensis DSM 21297 TaxID=1188261 RepID=U6SNS0_9BACI|nr:hypothetical protein [Alkalihalophilus marmarensis]ERN53263.1 hypothetical protein A33I_13005 [Alkalihalophilus marmarensis DSM 21297]